MRDPVFGFNGPPFASAPDPRDWVPVAGQQQAFESLAHCLNSGRGIAILTAPAGIGKSLLCHRIADHLRKNFQIAFLPVGRFEGPFPLLQAVLFELGRPYQGTGTQELRLQLMTALRENRRDGQGTVLILDEAHACSEDALEEIRAATNLCQDGRPLLRVLLSGQYELEEMLTSPRLDALNQRIGCHVSLEPFTRMESSEFVAHRLRQAGVDPTAVVTQPALQTIGFAAGGNPRCLNRLCDRSFELAAAAGRKPLDDATVRLALEELKRLPLHWNDPPPSADAIEPIETPPDVRDRVAPAASTETNGKEDFGDPAGETAVFEFGSDDFAPPAPASQPKATEPIATPRRKSPVVFEDEGTETSPSKGKQPAAVVPIATRSRGEDAGWTAVEQMPAVRRTAAVTAPDVCFATQPGLGSTRIQPAEGKRKSKPRNTEPLREEVVEDHYAALMAEQQRRPVRVKTPPATVRPVARPPVSPSRKPERTAPVEVIDTLLAAVEEAIDDGETTLIEAAPPIPRREVKEAAAIRFHSIEDYLRSARQDAVRMDREEPGPAPSESRQPDLYARLRRLQGR